MSAKSVIGDIEDELELFFVRKQNDIQCYVETSNRDRLVQATDSSSSVTDVVHEYIPLLLCDMPCSLDPTESSIYILGRVRFRTFIFYARVVGRMCDTNAYHKYVVDDGSCALELSVYRRRSDLEAMCRLQTEIAHLKMGSATSQNKNEVTDCLTRLLAKSMEQLNQSNIPLGTKILVQGRATWYRGQLGIVALNMYSEMVFARDVEIAFKDYLIDWYATHAETYTETS